MTLLYPDQEDAASVMRKRRVLYVVATTVLTAMVGLAAADALGLMRGYGVDTDHAVATGGGYELDVRFGRVTRPALATPFDIEVVRKGGFDGPVTIAVDSRYLALWDENGLDPSPASETADDTWVYWEFDPPPGDTLLVSFDARIEPAAQQGKTGRVAILDDDDRPVVAVSFTTTILP